MYVCIHTHTDMHTYIHTYIHTYVCTCVCVCVCVCMYVVEDLWCGMFKTRALTGYVCGVLTGKPRGSCPATLCTVGGSHHSHQTPSDSRERESRERASEQEGGQLDIDVSE